MCRSQNLAVGDPLGDRLYFVSMSKALLATLKIVAAVPIHVVGVPGCDIAAVLTIVAAV